MVREWEVHDMPEVTDYEKKLEAHDAQLRVHAEQIKQLQDNHIKLENVVMSESRETRHTVTQSNQQLHELIKGLMGYNIDKSQMTHKEKMAMIESIFKILGILSGTGGLLYYLFG